MLNNEEQVLFDMYKGDTPEATMANLKQAESVIEDPDIGQMVRSLILKLDEDPWVGIR